MNSWLLVASIAFSTVACTPVELDTATASQGATSRPASQPAKKDNRPGAIPDATGREIATVAGGCFWCMETPFEKLDGVTAVISGYIGGQQKNPTYEQVSRGETGHTEAVQIHFDPRRISYPDILEVFWRQINPTDAGGQFVDRGSQYRPGIFYHSDAQRAQADASKQKLASSGRFKKPIATEITKATKFYPAEEYHQDFYKKSPDRYNSYRRGSGRDRYLQATWGQDRDYKPKKPAVTAKSYPKPSDGELRKRLTDLQYRVTQQDATERSFNNTYWNNKSAGIYVDVVTGEPLFSSRDKFVSGTGWPSFTRPLVADHVKEERDTKLGYVRVEVRSKHGDSHLGHVFDDGPAPTGLRYCINSAALRFIPEADLVKDGYEEFVALFSAAKKK